ncbi:MAG: ATP-binding protein [Gammaproteobacteria bacterium]|nr:ATP-binding protein [Gammaproteobacteria bacterium]
MQTLAVQDIEVESLKAINRDLLRSNAELEQFAYIASHDLQEPLRTVTSFLQLLQSNCGNELSSEGKQYIDFAVQGSNRMKMLVNGLLEFSRLSSQEKELNEVGSGAVLLAVLENLELSIGDSGALIEYGQLPMVMADSHQLQLLLQNLISNSIKYRCEGDLKIRLNAEWLEGFWRFSVTDNGIGMEPQHFDRIFKIFQRLHAQGEYSGVGIGLAMCKKIVERHGGKIWVKSDVGVGATFYFTLKGLPHDE